MCPDTQLLSAFFDKELDTKWAAQVEDHVRSCTSCSMKLEKLRGLSKILEAAEVPQMEGRLIQNWQAIQRKRDTISFKPFWKRSFKLPVPLAAASLLFLLGAGAGLGVSVLGQDPQVQIVKEDLIPAQVEFNSMEELATYMQTMNSGITLSANLPEEQNFFLVGEPQLIRAIEYRQER